MLHPHEGGNVTDKRDAIVNRGIPELRVSLHVAHLGEDDPVLRRRQIDAVFGCDVFVIVADVAIAPAGFGRDRDEMTQHPWAGVAGGMKAYDGFPRDRLVNPSVDHESVSIVVGSAGAEFDEIGSSRVVARLLRFGGGMDVYWLERG